MVTLTLTDTQVIMLEALLRNHLLDEIIDLIKKEFKEFFDLRLRKNSLKMTHTTPRPTPTQSRQMIPLIGYTKTMIVHFITSFTMPYITSDSPIKIKQ